MRSAICWDFTRCRLVVYYNVSGQPISPTSKVKQSKKILGLFDPWNGTDILSRNVGNRLHHSTPRKIPEDFWSHVHRGGSLKSRKKYDDLTHTKTNQKLTRRRVCWLCRCIKLVSNTDGRDNFKPHNVGYSNNDVDTGSKSVRVYCGCTSIRPLLLQCVNTPRLQINRFSPTSSL
jgi:hypothetical protein